MFVSLVITTRGDRPELKLALESAKDVEEVIVIKDIPRKEHITRIDEGMKQARGNVLMTMTDRTILKDGWRQALQKGFEKLNGSGCVTFDNNYCGLAAVSRDFFEIELGGYFYWPDYIHYNGDQELGDRARAVRKYYEIPDAHLFNVRQEKRDKSQSQEFVQYDKETYDIRTNANWPNTRLRSDEERNRVLKQWL